MLWIVRRFAVPVLLVLFSADSVIESIFTGETKIIPSNSLFVAILIVHDAKYDETEYREDGTVADIMGEYDFNQERMGVARAVTFKLLSEAPALLATSTKGIVQIYAFAKFEESYLFKVAHGGMVVIQRMFFKS